MSQRPTTSPRSLPPSWSDTLPGRGESRQDGCIYVRQPPSTSERCSWQAPLRFRAASSALGGAGDSPGPHTTTLGCARPLTLLLLVSRPRTMRATRDAAIGEKARRPHLAANILHEIQKPARTQKLLRIWKSTSWTRAFREHHSPLPRLSGGK